MFMTPAAGDLRLTVLRLSKNCIEGILLYTHSGQYYHAVGTEKQQEGLLQLHQQQKEG